MAPKQMLTFKHNSKPTGFRISYVFSAIPVLVILSQGYVPIANLKSFHLRRQHSSKIQFLKMTWAVFIRGSVWILVIRKISPQSSREFGYFPYTHKWNRQSHQQVIKWQECRPSYTPTHPTAQRQMSYNIISPIVQMVKRRKATYS